MAQATSRSRCRRIHPRIWRNTGFTLVEVVCAAFVLAFALTSSLAALQWGFKMVEVARDTTLAAQLLQSQMEDLRLNNWGDMETLRDDCASNKGPLDLNLSKLLPTDDDITSKLTFLDQKKFALELLVTDVPDRENEILDVELRLQWVGLDGTSHQRSVRTYYTKKGLYDYYYTLARAP